MNTTYNGIGRKKTALLCLLAWTCAALPSFAIGVRRLPADYEPGVVLAVSIATDTNSGTVTVLIEESPPAGWTQIDNISDNGFYDAVNHRIYWPTFFSKLNPSVSYEVTPPGDATGEHCFEGTVLFNGIPCPFFGDECVSRACKILSSDPPSGAIDARQPYPVNDATRRQGISSIEITLTCDTTGLFQTGDFTVTEVGDDGIPAALAEVKGVGNTVSLTFVEPIHEGAWTVITHNDSGGEVCVGYLPADTNGDRLSSTEDINYLVDCLNLVNSCEKWQTDINRSGVANGQDLLREIDLLNGAGELGVWITQTLEVSPCGE